MNKTVDLLTNLIKIIPIILKILPTQKCLNYKVIIKKIIGYSVAFFFFISSYVFGCMTLFYYLTPHWGEPLSAFFLCILSLGIGFGFVIAATTLKKPKKNDVLHDALPALYKAVHSQDMQKLLAKASPAFLIMALGVIALGAYAVSRKRKQKS